jgi:uncharacterized protein (DUF1501 family)
MPTRRQIMGSLAALTVAGLNLPGLSRAASPAASPEDPRLVVVVLRGAMDGLAAVPPHGDPSFARLRRAPEGVLRLDDTFGLHPSLSGLHTLYTQGEALVFHAVATPYRDRSHFSGQDMLESGLASEGGIRDGWLGRALPPTGSRTTEAVAVGESVPLLLRGGQGVSSWSPGESDLVDDATLDRLAVLFEDDPLLSHALSAALDMQGTAGNGKMENEGRGRRQFITLMAAAGRFLAADSGPRVAAVDMTGWDTHVRQDARLERQLGLLDEGVRSLRKSIGDTWRRTAVLVVTEFGRTVAFNGSGGTDHGTGMAAFLLGGAVDGGRVIADWPGLDEASLLQKRDLRPTMDLRAVAKGVLEDHMGLPRTALDRTIFPDSQQLRPLSGLIRS